MFGAPLVAPLFEIGPRNATRADYFRSDDERLLKIAEIVSLMKDISVLADRLVSEVMTPHGIVHVDGKKEFAFSPDGDVMLVDVFATVEEDRFWRIFPNGQRVEFSLDPLRRYYEANGWKQRIQDGSSGQQKLLLPPPPVSLCDDLAQAYQEIRVAFAADKHRR
jgi:phosphoribosylaminoimidazole-succinocarboxamide synthase